MRRFLTYPLLFSFAMILLLTFPVFATSLNSSEKNSTKAITEEALAQISSEDSIQKILKRGVLRVAMYKYDRPPFFMTDPNGTLIGVDVELAHEIAARLGVQVEFNRTSETFDGVVKLVEDGICDVAISKLSLTLDRAKRVLYTKPYMIMSKSIIVNRFRLLQMGESSSLEELFSNPEAEIGVLANSSYQTFAGIIFPKAKVYPNSNWDGDIIPKLMKGEIWGAFRDELEVRRAMFVVKDASLRVLVVNMKDELDPMMMVVHHSAYALQKWLDLYVEFIHKPETIAQAIERFRDYVYAPQ